MVTLGLNVILLGEDTTRLFRLCAENPCQAAKHFQDAPTEQAPRG